jgi:hypothetical protein
MTNDYRWRGRNPRQELQATIWRWWPTRGPEAVHAVDAILDAADTYLRAVMSTAGAQCSSTPAEDPALTAERRAVLGDAVYRRPA